VEPARRSTFSGFVSKPVSDVDKPSHPWTELSLRDDKIIHGKAPKPETEYLSTPEVSIVGKKEVLVDIDGGRTSYAFKLNTAPDAGWRHLFNKNFENVPDGINRSDLRVEFKDDTLFLLCMPSKLEAKYAFVKDTVSKTNGDYKSEKETVRRRLYETAAQSKQDSAAGKGKIQTVKERFDKLQL